ncbi:hypothetical protein [Paenibacillus sp. DMB20]|uniref:hypothetical protein n=1 Tax=Paenibacillus sp. DMB20 TaxID=1642570 RepID=UPI001364E252|nr:hypothetical protein [Paenibacillus sp. DMB20]
MTEIQEEVEHYQRSICDDLVYIIMVAAKAHGILRFEFEQHARFRYCRLHIHPN